ncbi:MAG: 1-deoxy-D-xylulose-5-phosphate reductoisomerase [Pseudomonadota bacterium]
MARRISVFGSTGSIGQQTLDLIARDRQNFELFCLTGARNVTLLAEQAKELQPQIVITADDASAGLLSELLDGTGIKVQAGRTALLSAAQERVDWAMSSIVGFAGLEISLEIAKTGGVLALANKESLVCGGPLLRKECATYGATLLPVDSEHSAIFQLLKGEVRGSVSSVIITASGGPFRSWSREAMAGVTPAQAANHPKWSMGQRISIDSATLFNKALEVIEAKEIFDFSANEIEVIIHPQSVIHSMIRLKDQMVLAHLGVPDMRAAIGYALYYPDRSAIPVEPLDFAKLSKLDFEAPDIDRFPALNLAKQVMDHGGLAGAVLNGAKEAAMDAFLTREIGFLDMADLVSDALHDPAWQALGRGDQIDQIVAADRFSRDFVAANKGQRS